MDESEDASEQETAFDEDNSPPTPPLSSSSSGWDLITSVKVNDTYHVFKYRSASLGLELVYANVPGPQIHSYWIVPHKLEDETGLPHILQHMIWQGGSKRFPYPGLFQRIANQCFSSRPKSWAERDHSGYHVTTAGKEGFAKMLPVVFDHLFSPILQEASFLHEIYHVDGDGREHGSCLTDMIELETDPDEMATLELIRKTFGEESNYRYSISGTSESLRTLETGVIEKLNAFHKKFYHFSNCCLIICGDITKDELFNILTPVVTEQEVKPPKNWKRPWAEESVVKSTTDPVMSRITYPASPNIEAQKNTLVKVGILGPASTEKINRCVAMRLALEYLISGPLTESFTRQKHRTSIYTSVDGMTHLATTLSITEYEYKQTLFSVECHNVPLEMISTVPHMLRRTMNNQINDGGFDYERMRSVVERFYQEELTNLETRIDEKIVHAIIPDFLYLDKDSDLMFDRRINHAYTIHHFMTQPPEFWILVIQGMLESEWTTVGAIPSSQLQVQLKQESDDRIQQRLDPEKIKDTKRLAQRFKAAKKLFQKRPPAEFLDHFPLPSVESIGSSYIDRKDNPKWAQGTLCNLYVDDITSRYVYLTILMDTTELTFEEKKHLVLFAEGILNSPYVDSSDNFHSAEEMKAMMDKDCIQYETFFGLEWSGKLEDRTKFACGSFPHLFCLRFLLDVTKVNEGFQWAHNLLWNTKWQADKLKQTCLKLYREVDEELKGLGTVMTRAMLVDSLYLLNSVPKCISLIRQKTFIRRIGEGLPKSMRKVSKMLESIRMTILRPENCSVHVAGSLTRMEFNLATDPNQSNTRDGIAELFRQTFDYTGWHWGYDTRRLSNRPDMNWMRSPDCIAKCSREQILRMTLTPRQVKEETPESKIGCLIQAAPGIRSWQDPDYPILLLALQYFIQRDGGPLQTEIVESGLAEDVDIRVSPSEGLLYFEMRYCPNIATAYAKAYDVIAQHCKIDDNNEATVTPEASAVSVSVTGVWDDMLLSSAKSSMIFKMSTEESTPEYVSMMSLLSYYKNVPQLTSTRREIMGKIAAATLAQVQQVTGKYLKALFLEPCTCAASAPKENAIPIIKELMEYVHIKYDLTKFMQYF